MTPAAVLDGPIELREVLGPLTPRLAGLQPRAQLVHGGDGDRHEEPREVDVRHAPASRRERVDRVEEVGQLVHQAGELLTEADDASATDVHPSQAGDIGVWRVVVEAQWCERHTGQLEIPEPRVRPRPQ